MSGRAAAEPPYFTRAKPARNLRAAKPRVKFNSTLHQSSPIFSRVKFNSTLHQFSHGFATRVHGFATKTKALAHEIPPATQAIAAGPELIPAANHISSFCGFYGLMKL